MKAYRFAVYGLFLFAGSSMMRAQQTIGTVGVQDATVAGALEITNGRAVLVGNTTVTAREHMTEISLSRGGMVRVCATSGLHVTSSKGASAGPAPTASPQASSPLMLALDRGAIEVQMAATTRDMVLTPDLRFTMAGDGPLDLQLRVTKNGDTCVENRGTGAPTLNVADQFGEGTYQLRAGQHVLFEHGSLKEVVDHESSSCGCPPESPAPVEPTMTVADALLNSGAAKAGDATAGKTAAELHPFPAAVSAGLAPPATPTQAPVGVVQRQVTATLSSTGGQDSLTPAQPAAADVPPSTTAPVAPAANAAQPPSTPPAHSGGVMHAVGRFFRRIFGGG
jgi:hypothetical protein